MRSLTCPIKRLITRLRFISLVSLFREVSRLVLVSLLVFLITRFIELFLSSLLFTHLLLENVQELETLLLQRLLLIMKSFLHELVASLLLW